MNQQLLIFCQPFGCAFVEFVVSLKQPQIVIRYFVKIILGTKSAIAMQLLQTIGVLKELLECLESENGRKLPLVVVGAQGLGIKSRGYAISAKRTEVNDQTLECLKTVSQKHKLDLRQIGDYWVLCKT